MARDFGFKPIDIPPYYFISYNSQDSSRVAAICREMNRRDIPMWYDKGLLSGEKWEKQIISKIKSCREVIMFVTKRLMIRENPYVRKEFFFAQQFHKKIHVVMLDEINFNDVSDDLKGWFFDLEALHGVYPPAGADPKTIVDTMDGLIAFLMTSDEVVDKERKKTIKKPKLKVPKIQQRKPRIRCVDLKSFRKSPKELIVGMDSEIIGALLGVLILFILFVFFLLFFLK